MSSMSRNSSSSNSSSSSLMSFSVSQPALGAPLQFFPEMGSAQLDELIDAYIPGPALILDKRRDVTVEFFNHAMATGENFKFFLVCPAVTSSTASPASTIQDSGYGSTSNTSPNMTNDNVWRQSFDGDSWPLAAPKKARKSGKKAGSSSSRSHASDFSHIPGMKIMTKEGLDVTNSASRGCKTKEQRDHAHLMRVLKACDSCKRKKTRCDPSHKRGSSTDISSDSKVSKKARKSRAPPSQKPPSSSAAMKSDALTFDSLTRESLSFDASFMITSELSMDDWDQYIKYDEEVNDAIPQDYDFFFDPATYYSPITENSASASSSQVLTPASGLEVGSGVQFVGADLLGVGDSQQPMLPYLDGGVDVGNNYVDFALYSPGSTYLDDELEPSKDVAGPRGPDIYHRQASSSSHKPDVRSTLLGGVAASPHGEARLQSQDGLLHDQADHNAYALGNTGNAFVKEGVVQSDQNYRDPGHDRNQLSEHSSSAGSTARSRTSSPAGTPESRVPCETISSSGLSLGGLPPRLQTVPVASGNSVRQTVFVDDIERRHLRQSLPAINAGGNGLVTAPILSSPERTPTTGLATTATTATTATATSVYAAHVPSNDKQQHVSSVTQRPLPEVRHQRRPEDSAFGRASEGILFTGAHDAAQTVMATTDVVANGITRARLTVGPDRVVQSIAVSPGRTLSSSGDACVQNGAMSQAATFSQATSLPVVGINDGTQTGLSLVQGPLAATILFGLEAISLARSGNVGIATYRALSSLAILSSLAVVAMAIGQGVSSPSSLDRGQPLSLSSALFVALSFVVASGMSQQYSVPCTNKPKFFTKALDLARRLPSMALSNVKPKTQRIQCELLDFKHRSLGPASSNIALSHLGMVF
ncbi:hypothetical protein TruAng_007842 [Truncatella angustata]|nr:hypothetical protein TruAng_007842 [Truncatella angustata]